MRNRLLFNPRRLLLRALLGIAAIQLPLAAIAGFNFFTSEYTVSRNDLQKQIAKRFPVQQRYAEIFTVGLSDPQMSFDASANRATITARLSIRNPLFNPQAVDGIVAVSSALRYDAATRSLRLDQPKTERLELQGLSGHDAERLQKIGALVAQELLRDYALRTFTVDELTVGRKTYEIGAITVEAEDIRVELK
jgi:hypothetical protein